LQNENTKGEKLRVGIISALWLPKFGGAEQYLYRMANGLNAQGLDVRVFTGTGQKVGFDNGQLAATRFVPKGDLEIVAWRSNFSDRTPDYLKRISNHFGWFNEAIAWSKKNAIDVALICNPFQQVYCFHANEMYLRLRDAGIKIGIVHHDLPPSIESFVQQVYQSGKKSWEEVSSFAMAELGKAVKAKPGLEGFLEIASPLAFAPDFVVSNSEWVSRFIDPLKSKKHFIFHGPIDADYWRKLPTDASVTPHKDVLMINPQQRKGPAQMRDLIEKGSASWTYRVLKGGWGDAFKSFQPMVKTTKALKENRIEFVEYVKDMRPVYAAAGVMFFPSHYEGYGLAAVEPMFLGTPVVSSNYPAIKEATGEGALSLCPLRNSPEEWRDAVATVLNNRSHWSEKALAWAETHRQRQATQIVELSKFIAKQVQK
jgi:glycosyltransferase involved in cell wall biosynthesis